MWLRPLILLKPKFRYLMSGTKYSRLSANPEEVLCAALPGEAMKIYLKNISKRYHHHWIFKKISYVFEDGGAYVILGANGSGKSTLLRIIGGMQGFNAGELSYSLNDSSTLPPEKIFEQISYCAPGM